MKTLSEKDIRELVRAGKIERSALFRKGDKKLDFKEGDVGALGSILAAVKELAPPRKWKFTVDRDHFGYIESVIAEVED